MYSHTIAFRDDETLRTGKQRTLMIYGVNRGGTTAVAGGIRRMGVFLGDDMEGNLEDKCFRFKHGLDAIRATVAQRNADYDVWGWKHPHPHQYIDEILPELRNPRLILVTRDMTANTLGVSSWDQEALGKGVGLYMGQTRKNVDLMWNAKCPVMLVSYEKLVLKPEAVLKELAHFCGLTPKKALVSHAAEFIKPGAYQPEEAKALTFSEYCRHRGSLIKRRFLKR
ncbi:sulfotransferase [Shimia sp. R11_0]|uniref:sulfotransferase n=1 Tax=Shimia sp. R11_0 TaxID=2821096 RepID=UPI001ADC265C|nr:sulfotransferase [Shimia sp. R11_0]